MKFAVDNNSTLSEIKLIARNGIAIKAMAFM